MNSIFIRFFNLDDKTIRFYICLDWNNYTNAINVNNCFNSLFREQISIFLSSRVGKNLKSFTLIKFRTMSKGTENCATHLVDSSRITTSGAFLRRTKLDEIPQLLNVLKGEMSLLDQDHVYRFKKN